MLEMVRYTISLSFLFLTRGSEGLLCRFPNFLCNVKQQLDLRILILKADLVPVLTTRKSTLS